MKEPISAPAAPSSAAAQGVGAQSQGSGFARSVIKVIKERDPKNKDKYHNKYLTLHEVPEDAVTSGALFESSSISKLRKCDAIIYMFESNDAEQVDFVKVAREKFKEYEELRFVPHILLQSKMDLQMPESGENRSMLGQTLAGELQIKVYKEVSAVQSDLSEVVDAILMACNEPQCGLGDDQIASAKESASSSGIIDFISERPAFTSALLAFVATGLGLIVYTLKKKR